MSQPKSQPLSQLFHTCLQAQPAILPPFNLIQLSSDSESGVNLSNDLDVDDGDETNGGGGAESIADRVAARHRALFGSNQNIL